MPIPATTGQDACTAGGWSELRPEQFDTPFSATDSSVTIRLGGFTRQVVRTWVGTNKNTYALSMAVVKNRGDTSINSKSIGTVSGDAIQSNNHTLSGLQKNTRYVVILCEDGNPGQHLLRRCFKMHPVGQAGQYRRPQTRFARSCCLNPYIQVFHRGPQGSSRCWFL
ncbi:MAG: hypothetical protein OXD33_14960 [Rhodobacteraceae bacterium]|nr:hypothetical protein [Paracoccaceae bacterium]